MARIKFIFMSAIAVFVLFGGVLSPLATAMAVTCSGFACDGTSPVTTGCSSGAVNKKTVYVVNNLWPYDNLSKVELRYSPTCKTVWTRNTILSSDGAFTSYVYLSRYNPYNGATATYELHDHGLWQGQSNYGKQYYVPPASDPYYYKAKSGAYVTNGTVAAGEDWTTWWLVP